MTLASPTTCGSGSVSVSVSGNGSARIGHQLAISIVLLSIVLLSPVHALPRPAVGALPTQLLFNELLANGPALASDQVNEDNAYYVEQLHQQQQQQQKPASSFNHFVNKWPSLRDLLLTADYEDDSFEREQNQVGSRLLARLHRLGDNMAELEDEQLRLNMLDDLTAMPTKKQSEGSKLGPSAKQHNIKKNVQYMSPCHFKICNMGRKRNAGSFIPY